MKKTVKKTLCVLLTFCMLISMLLPSFAAEKKNGNEYPYVLVHGMMGWGENALGSLDMCYWGFTEDTSITDYLRGKGCSVIAPSVGPLSSAWDRACELYAQLTGTVVDYGKAHSERYGHSRYGRDYTGKAMLGENWTTETKINLVSHSFGGPAVTAFTSLLYYGCEEEILASPDDCSPLFVGGNDCVFSISTFSSPHNGTPLANLLYKTRFPIFAFALIVNLSGMSKGVSFDFMMDQWGLTCDPSTGKRASFNPSAILRATYTKDTCAYDMTIEGAKELSRYKTVDSVYYFSYSADMTKEGACGTRVVDKEYAQSFFPISASLIVAMSNKKIGGEFLDKSWAENDGLVPVPSAKYPKHEENNHRDFVSAEDLKSGVWYVMPTQKGNHGYHVMAKRINEGFYDRFLEITGSIK